MMDSCLQSPSSSNANYKALRAAEKGLTEKEATDKLKVKYKGFTDEEKSEWRSYDPNPTPAKKAVQTRGRKPKAADGKGKKVEVDEEEVAPESEEASVYGRCSFNRLIRICKNLNLEQKDVIQNAGFGSFIREDAPYIDTRLVSWLIKHVDPTTSILDLYGRKIHLSAAMFGDVMGVDDGGDPVVTEGTVLAPKTGCDITSGYLHSLRVTRDIRHKNWATAGFRYLMNSIFRFQNKATKNVSGCTLFLQMFVPVLTLEGAPHWFGAEVNMKSKVVAFLDSLHTAMDEKYRVDATKEMLSTLDLLFEENRSKNVNFVDFGIDRKDCGLPQQDNDRDCGVYVMKYMEAVANEEEVVAQFHPVEARLEIAARIITDEQNEIRTKVVEDRRAAQGSSFASSSAPLRSPSKSPRDPRFSTAKSRHTNMFPSSRASPRFQSSKTKISYGE
ncbi:hypothetical protein CsatB_005536 [Cannabis sativa]